MKRPEIEPYHSGEEPRFGDVVTAIAGSREYTVVGVKAEGLSLTNEEIQLSDPTPAKRFVLVRRANPASDQLQHEAYMAIERLIAGMQSDLRTSQAAATEEAHYADRIAEELRVSKAEVARLEVRISVAEAERDEVNNRSENRKKIADLEEKVKALVNEVHHFTQRAKEYQAAYDELGNGVAELLVEGEYGYRICEKKAVDDAEKLKWRSVSAGLRVAREKYKTKYGFYAQPSEQMTECLSSFRRWETPGPFYVKLEDTIEGALKAVTEWMATTSPQVRVAELEEVVKTLNKTIDDQNTIIARLRSANNHPIMDDHPPVD